MPYIDKRRGRIRVKNVEKVCQLCNQTYLTNKTDARKQKFCSVACALKVHLPKMTAIAAIANRARDRKGRTRSDGYIFSVKRDHPAATREGYVAKHRLVAEEKIGRFLKPKEVVHHWDEKPSNNDPQNLAVLRSQSAHARLHMFARRHKLQVEQLKFDQPWLSKEYA